MTYRLPERLADRWPIWSVEVAIGILVPVALIVARLPLESHIGDRAPYAFNFLAVLIAAVAAGWRSGLVALVAGQMLTWYAVVLPQWSFAVDDSSKLWGLAVASLSQALLLLVITLYQREVDKGVAERERRLELLEHARHEIDHRIRNNFQTVLALIHLQARRSEGSAKEALAQVAERIKAIAAVTERLAIRGEDLATVSIRDHLCDLCEQLQQGLAREGIAIHCEIAEVESRAAEATYLGLIVNELVTNALKHAFTDGRSGWVRVEGRINGQAFLLEIRDNGIGMKKGSARSGSGLGQKLVETFVRELGATHEVSTSDRGTTHRISVPDLAPPSRARPEADPSIIPALAPAAATARS